MIYFQISATGTFASMPFVTPGSTTGDQFTSGDRCIFPVSTAGYSGLDRDPIKNTYLDTSSQMVHLQSRYNVQTKQPNIERQILASIFQELLNLQQFIAVVFR